VDDADPSCLHNRNEGEQALQQTAIASSNFEGFSATVARFELKLVVRADVAQVRHQ
jgi:hypothetical protein